MGDSSNTSFHSQISSVLKVEGKKDLYIACADRWAPDKMEIDYEVCKKYYDQLFGEEGARQEILDDMNQVLGNDFTRNTSNGKLKTLSKTLDYVFKPQDQEGGDASCTLSDFIFSIK